MKTLNNNEKEQLYKKFAEQVKNVSGEDVKKAIDEAKKKFENLEGRLPEKLKEIWQDLKDMWRMLVDYYNGKYTEVPWGTIAAIVVALLYFVSPIDLIPDFIPVVGYIDDVFVISLALKLIGDDLDSYRKWRENQSSGGKDVSITT